MWWAKFPVVQIRREWRKLGRAGHGEAAPSPARALPLQFCIRPAGCCEAHPDVTSVPAGGRAQTLGLGPPLPACSRSLSAAPSHLAAAFVGCHSAHIQSPLSMVGRRCPMGLEPGWRWSLRAGSPRWVLRGFRLLKHRDCFLGSSGHGTQRMPFWTLKTLFCYTLETMLCPRGPVVSWNTQWGRASRCPTPQACATWDLAGAVWGSSVDGLPLVRANAQGICRHFCLFVGQRAFLPQN